MKLLFYSTKAIERPFLEKIAAGRYEIRFEEESLSPHSVSLSKGYSVISVFTSDDVSADVLKTLKDNGVKLIVLRSTGFHNVDLAAAKATGMAVMRVGTYSPEAIAEHAVALILALNRKLIAANERVRRYDFRIEGLGGNNLNNSTVGIIGTGKTGSALASILHGFGCKVLAHDQWPDQQLAEEHGFYYTDLPDLCSHADIISLHLPLTPQTRYLVNTQLIQKMKKGVMLINTACGALVKTDDLIPFLQNGHIACYGADVYEGENGIFFHDLSKAGFNDPLLKTLLQLPNVLVTPHLGFATREALEHIATATFYNIESWESYGVSGNELTPVNIDPGNAEVLYNQENI